MQSKSHARLITAIVLDIRPLHCYESTSEAPPRSKISFYRDATYPPHYYRLFVSILTRDPVSLRYNVCPTGRNWGCIELMNFQASIVDISQPTPFAFNLSLGIANCERHPNGWHFNFSAVVRPSTYTSTPTVTNNFVATMTTSASLTFRH